MSRSFGLVRRGESAAALLSSLAFISMVDTTVPFPPQRPPVSSRTDALSREQETAPRIGQSFLSSRKRGETRG